MSKANYVAAIEDNFIKLIEYPIVPGQMSITNDAEQVVETLSQLYDVSVYPILYQDTQGIWDSMLVEDRKFKGFRVLNAQSFETAKFIWHRLEETERKLSKLI